MIACSIMFVLSSDAICRQQETAEQFIERVKKAIENDEWGRAPAGTRHALSLKPKSPEALFLAAKVYLHEGAPSMAIESLKSAIENQPVYPGVLSGQPRVRKHLPFIECTSLRVYASQDEAR